MKISDIRIDGGTQPRCRIDTHLVDEYAVAFYEGAQFPPVVVFFDGVDHWLADGFHRYHGANNSGMGEIEAEIINGTLRDAILYSVGANAAHGQRRTNEDKRKAVLTLLGDEEWARWSDREIAERCGVTREYVNRIRSTCDQITSDPTRTYRDKRGNVGEMNVENIGRRRERVPENYGSIATDAHQPTYQPPPMTPRTAFEFPRDPAIVAAALYERFGADFAGELIDQLKVLIGRES